MKYAIDQFRLYLAESFIRFAAFVMAPQGHPDTIPLIKAVRDISLHALSNDTIAISAINEARQRWAGNDLEIDDNPMTSRGEGGCWISAWVWVPDRKNGE